MATLPKLKKQQLFDKELDGVFGQFKTKQSFAMNYLLTSIKINRLDWLQTAADVLDMKTITFEEIVQRDIDYERVQKEIIENYLQEGSGRVVFFPPLMVTLFGIDVGRPIENYTSVEPQIVSTPDGDKYVVRYDKSRFEYELPLAQDDETLHSLTFNGKALYYHHYAATLRLNSDKVKLVVLDGQHRLTALKKLIDKGGGDLIADIDLPLCIFFAPDAIKTGNTKESLVKDMRELFVTINKQAKEVSGHFLWLLKDKSLAAMCVRMLGDEWKKRGGDFSYLHQLEWNQREASKARQTQKSYSITTVSIIAETLQDYIFTNKSGLTYSLLNLGEVAEELQTSEGAPVAADINETRFELDQSAILKKQIVKYITPSLDILFSSPSPYKVVRSAFERALDLLNKEVKDGIEGHSQFRNRVLSQFRYANNLDPEEVQTAEKQFVEKLKSDATLSDVTFYTRNVFHQALIRAWADLFNILMELGLSPDAVAKAVVAGLEPICFNPKKKMFDPYTAYFSQRVFYKVERIIVSEVSKTSLKLLLLANFTNPKAREEFTAALGVDGSPSKLIHKKLEEIGIRCAGEYLKIFRDRQIDWLESEWKFAELSERDQAYLSERANSTDEIALKEFRDKIEELVAKRVVKAKDVLASMLEVKASVITMAGVAGAEAENGTEES